MNQTLTLEEIYTPIERSIAAIPQTISDILSTPNELARDVIEYFFSGRGKLLRPALTLLGYETEAQDSRSQERLLRLASAFEIFHAATLIHDDIIDSAYLRRNLPTINVKWNSQVAVLVGDYLHDNAMAAVHENANQKITSLFLETAGMVCDGEIQEFMQKGNFNLREAGYLEIVEKKTAALLACCVESGAHVAEADRETAAALGRFGRWFGMAFQIVDDCLDFTGNENEFGKTLGADCVAGVMTLPVIRLLDLAGAKQKEQIIRIFKSGGGSGKYKTLLEMIREYKTIDYALEKARQFRDKAQSELKPFSDSPAKQSLAQLADYVLERNR